MDPRRTFHIRVLVKYPDQPHRAPCDLCPATMGACDPMGFISLSKDTGAVKLTCLPCTERVIRERVTFAASPGFSAAEVEETGWPEIEFN